MRKLTVAIIPARGGSKRIPGKNIRPFAGNPMISYPIKAALDSKVFDRIIVTTDSEEIADIAKKFGAEVPFMRPPELADDFAETRKVLKHALEWLKNDGCDIGYFCCVYATTPFLKKKYLREGYELLKRENAASAFSVGKFPGCIQRAFKVNDQGRISMMWPENYDARTNDFPEAYMDAGQFYWANAEHYMTNWQFLTDNTLPIELPRHLVHDIDTEEDWELAELYYQAMELRDARARS